MVMGMTDEATIPELERRLISALLQPVVSMCRRFRVPLNELEGLCRVAYYEELRHRGDKATQAEVAEVFGTSLRTVVGVEKRYQGRFDADDAETTRWRRVEQALTSEGQSVEALAGQLDIDNGELRRTLSGLVAAGRAVVEADAEGIESFVRTERYRSLVRADLVARIDGLKHQLEVVESAVRRRFVETDDERPAVARTLSFLGTEADVAKLADLLVKTLRLEAIDVEERALEGGGYQRYGATFAVAPVDGSD